MKEEKLAEEEEKFIVAVHYRPSVEQLPTTTTTITTNNHTNHDNPGVFPDKKIEMEK